MLEAHLGHEDRLYYPALRALRPAERDALWSFATAHEAFRARLRAIAAALAQGPLDAAWRLLERTARELALHERQEEILLRRIDADLCAEEGARSR
jgi:hypothetical protein